MKFRFECTDDDFKSVHEVETYELNRIVDHFLLFLKGNGYAIEEIEYTMKEDKGEE